MEDSFFNLGNEAFSLTGYKCQVYERSEADGKIITSIATDSSSEIHYAFSGEKGLCMTTPYGTVLQSDLLGKLLSIEDNEFHNVSEDGILRFCEEYGFLFPLRSNEECILNFMHFHELFTRMKVAALLQSALNDIDKDLLKILHYSMYLLFASRIDFSAGSQITYKSTNFKVLELIENPILSWINEEDVKEAEDKGTYTVSDTMFPPSYEIDADEYNDIISGGTFTFNYPGIKDGKYRKITALYKNANSETKSNRIVIDFLFHFMHEISVIELVTYSRGIIYYNKHPDLRKLNEPAFKQGLINTAKIILAQEINYNVAKMRPVYNPVTMRGTWKAPNLLTALYFSMFYRAPGTTLYKRCANPTCSNFIEIAVTNGRKKYCCDACRNAKNQRDHRFRQKKTPD